MKFETIIYEKEGPLAWITLNRPEKLRQGTMRRRGAGYCCERRRACFLCRL